MSDWQINSALLAAHNVALALGQIAHMLGYVAFALFVYPWLGGFSSYTRRNVTVRREEP